MEHRVVSATEFKAKCLALLDEMENNAATITITRRGKPVAVLSPIEKKWKSPKGSWAKKMTIVGDIVNEDFSQDWEVVREPHRFD